MEMRSDSPDTHDPFIVDEDSNFEQLYFQLNRAIKFVEREYTNNRIEFLKHCEAEDTTITRLRKEIDDFEYGGYSKDNARVIIERQEEKNCLKNISTEVIAATKEEKELKEQLKAWQAEKDRMRKSVFEKKKMLGSQLETTTRLSEILRRKNHIEGRVELLNHRLGKAMLENSKLRKILNDLKFHYQKYRNIEKSMEFKLTLIKNDIADQVEKAHANLKVQKSVSRRLEAMLVRHERDQQSYLAEIREMKLGLIHGKKLHSFLVTKGDARQDQYLHELTVNQRVDEEVFMANENRMIEQYETAFKTIFEITELDDIAVICGDFEKKEKDILRRTKYANDLRTEVVVTLNEHANQKDMYEIESHVQKRIVSKKRSRARFTDLEAGKIAVSLDDIEDKIEKYMKKIDNVRANINEIIKIFPVERAKFEDELVKPKIDHRGVVRYLNLLAEYATSAVVQAEFFKFQDEERKAREQGGVSVVLPKPKISRRDTFELKVPLPSMTAAMQEDNHSKLDTRKADSSELEIRPFTRMELQERARHNVLKKEVVKRLNHKNDDDNESLAGSVVLKRVMEKAKERAKSMSPARL